MHRIMEVLYRGIICRRRKRHRERTEFVVQPGWHKCASIDLPRFCNRRIDKSEAGYKRKQQKRKKRVIGDVDPRTLYPRTVVQTLGDGVSKDLSGCFGGGVDPPLVTGKTCASIGESFGVGRHLDGERRRLHLGTIASSPLVAMAVVVAS
jgi:hypothetical protein